MSNLPSERKPHAIWEILTRAFLASYPLVVAFHIWLVTKIHAHDLAIQELKSWQGNMPKFGQADAENLRLRVLTEVRADAAVQNAGVIAKLESIQATVIRLEERHKLQEALQAKQ